MTDLTRVHDVVAAQAARRPDALAVSAPDAVLTYADLDRRATMLARRLLDAGAGTESRVGLCLPRSAALVVGALAILKAGAAYVALDPANPAQRLRFMVEDSGASILVTTAGIAGALEHQGTVLTVPGDDAAGGGEPAPLHGDGASLDDLAYVIYTSGSTGQPKGVLVEHCNLLNLVRWHRRAFELTEDDRGTQVASPGFDAVVWELWPLLTSGASVHVPPEALRTDPAALRDWLVEQRITISFLPTAIAEAVIALDWPADTALGRLLTGGDALRHHPRPGLPFAVVNNYGPAEGTVVATSGPVPATTDAGGAPPTIGRAIDGVTLHVVDDALHPVPGGAVGELLIGGAGVARGYLNRPDLTAERFIPDSLGGGTGHLYRTGDLVRARADGQIEFVGRADEQVQVAGRRIELGEIAATLERHPAVERAVVIAGDVPSGTRLVACVVASDGEQPGTDELHGTLAQTLPGYMIPSAFVWLDSLPMSTSDKVDRVALAALVARVEQEAAASVAAPANQLEAEVAGMVAELLGVPTVDVTDNFFLLGGHSLLGAQLIARIGDRFGVELPLRDVFEHPTVAEMAELVEAGLVAGLEGMSDEEAERLSEAIAGSAAGASQ